MLPKNTHLQKGDTVRFLNEKGGGVISKITKEFVYVEIDGNFEVPVLHSEVILISSAPKDVKEQDVSEQQNIHSETIYTEEFITKPISHTASKLSKGMYLLFVPVNQQILIAGDIMLYLLNYTNYTGFFSLSYPQIDNSNATYKGEFESSTALLLDTISRNDIAAHTRGTLQCIFTSHLDNGTPNPITTIIDIKSNKFLKEESYTINIALQMAACSIKLFDKKDIYFSNNIFAKDYDDILQPLKAEMQEKTSLISKYQSGHLEAEVDLHYEKIMPDKHNTNSNDKMRVQLDLCKACLESAIKEEYKKVVFIHGVGVGILKIEIHNILNSYEQIEYRDAPISKYGIGATEVLIYKKK